MQNCRIANEVPLSLCSWLLCFSLCSTKGRSAFSGKCPQIRGEAFQSCPFRRHNPSATSAWLSIACPAFTWLNVTRVYVYLGPPLLSWVTSDESYLNISLARQTGTDFEGVINDVHAEAKMSCNEYMTWESCFMLLKSQASAVAWDRCWHHNSHACLHRHSDAYCWPPKWPICKSCRPDILDDA